MSERIDLDSHPLVANCADQYNRMAHSLLVHLKQLHERGPALHPGSKIEFGFSMLQIEAHPQHWVVCEPDYQSEPMIWRPKVDDTLWVMQRQTALHTELGLTSSLRTRGDQWLWLQADALNAEDVYLHRSEPTTEQDSGWYIGVENPAIPAKERHAKRVIAGSLLKLKSNWLCALALPVGYLVQLAEDQLVGIYDDQQRCIYHSEI